jgi:hypothetical protein
MPTPDPNLLIHLISAGSQAVVVVVGLMTFVTKQKTLRIKRAINEERLLLKEQLLFAKNTGYILDNKSFVEAEVAKYGHRKTNLLASKSVAAEDVALTGQFAGFYYYLVAGTANKLTKKHLFKANLVCRNGQISGSFEDKSDLGASTIAGTLDGLTVQFEKRYNSGDYPTVRYSGTLTADRAYISGTWHVDDPKQALDGLWIMTKRKLYSATMQ